MRDGNIFEYNEALDRYEVVSLPMRMETQSLIPLVTISRVVSLPMRDGNPL